MFPLQSLNKHKSFVYRPSRGAFLNEKLIRLAGQR